MNASFSFEIDRPRDLVRIQMSGLFTAADVAAFVEARRRAHAQLGCAPNRHLTLNDVRQMKIQTQEIVAEFRLMLSDPPPRLRRRADPGPGAIAARAAGSGGALLRDDRGGRGLAVRRGAKRSRL